ncbi:MAG: hypothetical protein AB7W16_15055 [Candidatus Obscuribacterales bacterium]
MQPKNRLMTRFTGLALSLSIILGLAASPVSASDQSEKKPENEENPEPKFNHRRKIKVLEPSELDKLLKQRINGQLGLNFGSFANMFFIQSKIETDVLFALSCDEPEMSRMPLEPGFPSTYKPTVTEFLDALALETNSRWVYDEKYQYARSTEPAKPGEKELEGTVDFHFLPAKNKLGFEITPAEGWKALRRSNWIMYIPPTAKLAMDLHVLGSLSCDDESKMTALLESAPVDHALDSLKRANPDATAKDLQKKKVGEYDAYFFETKVPTNGEAKYRWRQWHFMVGNRLCYVISTVPLDLDSQLYPDIEKMLKTFRPVAE